jgi:serine/threonine protein kinase
VRLLDFGVSMMERSEEEAASDAVGLTPTGALVGTPAYMAPEQLLGASAATPACDVYSLGIVLYELAAGRHPFAAREGMGLLVAHATEMVPALDAVDPGIPAGLARLVAGAIAKDPVERPGAAALADALARLADGAPDVRGLFDGVPDPDSVEATDVSPAT